MRFPLSNRSSDTGWQTAAVIGAAGLLGSFLYVQAKKRSAERANPPSGKFVDVDGVRLHYLDQGEGPALVLLHGNGLFSKDFELSGLLDSASQNHRVIAFDRPGFGHSERPGNTRWTPEAQAKLIYNALHALGIERPIVVGHSWGALVALSMALDFSKYVRAITLVGGYFYPSARLDAVLASAPAIPLIGHLLRYTISPLIGRMLWPGIIKRTFGPAPIPARFRQFPVWMSLRPSQVAASAAESALLRPAATRLSKRYAELTMPVAVIAGRDDRIASTDHHAARFHGDVQHSDLLIEPGVGHMAHYADPARIMAAVARLEAALAPAVPSPRPEATVQGSTTLH